MPIESRMMMMKAGGSVCACATIMVVCSGAPSCKASCQTKGSSATVVVRVDIQQAQTYSPYIMTDPCCVVEQSPKRLEEGETIHHDDPNHNDLNCRHSPATANHRRHHHRTVCVSAPGKILLSGGYLVLEPSTSLGLVLAVDKRFYVTAKTYSSLVTSNKVEAKKNIENDDEYDDQELVDASPTSSPLIVHVDSPQFGEEYMYRFDRYSYRLLPDDDDDDKNATSSKTNTSSSCTFPKNTFVQQTLQVCLLYVFEYFQQRKLEKSEQHPSGVDRIDITIHGDNEFWSHPRSQDEEATAKDLHHQQRFLPAPRDEQGQICKTGLGSSACLVTSLVAALYVLLLLHPTTTKDDNSNHDDTNEIFSSTSTVASSSLTKVDLERISIVAQLAHCVAQGKIGSGFDVSAACYGSHIYQRFDPNQVSLDQLVSELQYKPHNDTTSSYLQQIVESSLTQSCVQHPLYFLSHKSTTTRRQHDGIAQILLADTAQSCGSSSPSLSQRVVQHRLSEQWHELDQINRSIITTWIQLSQLESTIFSNKNGDQIYNSNMENFLEKLAHCPAANWMTSKQFSPNGSWNEAAEQQVLHLLYQLHTLFQQWRQSFRELGTVAGVELEPDIQTQLANDTQMLPGVITAVMPGAGGYDALACLYINHPTVRRTICDFWRSRNVATLNVRAASFGDGIRLEHSE